MKNKNVNIESITTMYRIFGGKIAFTNGVFDLLHCGHVDCLRKAREYGHLIVAINSDNSVRKIKGQHRPIILQDQRKYMLDSLSFIDHVFIFDELTPIDLIKKIKPDFLIKGEDWTIDEIVGREFVESYGGKVINIPLIEGISTTKIIEKCKNHTNLEDY